MIWNLIAKFCARPAVADWLIRRAQARPYSDIVKDGEVYMWRGWVFNPYDFRPEKTRWQRFMARLPSARVHHIRLPDRDRHLHSHPWDARTILLKGGYSEVREADYQGTQAGCDIYPERHLRAGDTATLDINDYHRIVDISEGGVWTLFITWKYQGTWGFLVDGKKVPYREYLGL